MRLPNSQARWDAVLVLLLQIGCGGTDAEDATAESGGANGSGGSGGSSSSGTGGSSGAGDANSTSSGDSGGASSGSSSTTSPVLPMVPGDPDPEAPDTELPELPALVNVNAVATHDSVFISFDPIDGARDYRVYVLPDDEDITVEDDGYLSIQNAIYRCAGDRQTPPTEIDDETIEGNPTNTRVDNQKVAGFTRTLDDARLGYVFATPGEGRVPVYALGEGEADSDNDCFGGVYGATRVKQYVTSSETRDELLANGARDDGIVFYAPDTSDSTLQVFTSEDGEGRYYFSEGPEADMREGAEPAFRVLADAEDSSVPLMRVFYAVTCGRDHDELVAGMTRFERARFQGSDTPMYDVHWSGLTEETTLVVEALAGGCPSNVPGLLAPESRDSYTAENGKFDYPAWLTLDEVRDLSDIGEVYINGQHEADSRPIPVARSFVRVSPGPKPDLDWFMGFGEDESLGTLEDVECGTPSGNCFQQYRMASDEVDISFIAVETPRYAVGSMLGELWVTYSDWAGDTNGKFRMTPSTRGEITADSFLYVTMEVDAITTSRRYPQFLISDQPPPVQHTMVNGNTIIVQTFGNWQPVYELEVCDHRAWDVNDQCPRADLHRYYDDSDAVVGLAPHPELGEHIGVDRPTRFEAYVSSERAYLFLDGLAYGCVDLPSSGVPTGEVTVTFGDVLYHSGVDLIEEYDYYREQFQHQTRRHFDNLGFKSGVPAPAWDEGRFPCTSRLD